MTTVGIVGLGKIGGAIATHILAAGHPVLAWTRRPDALGPVVAAGATAVPTVAALAPADIVLSVVFDDAATRAVALDPGGLVDALRPGAIHVAMETISPALSRTIADAHAARGQRYLAAPVFGRPDAALRGELAIVGSGPLDTFRAVEPVLRTAGTTRWIGPDPEQAMLLKLAGNGVILAMAELLGETIAVLRAGGISPADTKTALFDTLMPGVLAGYAERLAADPDAPRPAASPIGRKDNALLRDAAAALGIDLPLARALAPD